LSRGAFAIATAIFIILFVLLVVFSTRYRQGTTARRGPLPKLLRREIEIGWTAATTFLAIFIFWWFVGGSGLPPRAAPRQLEIHSKIPALGRAAFRPGGFSSPLSDDALKSRRN